MREERSSSKHYVSPEGRRTNKMSYLIICKLDNGNIITAFAGDFKTALSTAEMFNGGDYTKEVTIITVETGATTKFIF